MIGSQNWLGDDGDLLCKYSFTLSVVMYQMYNLFGKRPDLCTSTETTKEYSWLGHIRVSTRVGVHPCYYSQCKYNSSVEGG